jgi:SAM-dependent methyltransferase
VIDEFVAAELPMTDRSQHEAHTYDSIFYEYQREGSLRSARALLPLVVSLLDVKSVLDVGCGAGAWLAAYRGLGATDCIGVDGDYVDRDLLMVEPSWFSPRDITKRFDFGREFDLVQCLEVAEHIPGNACDTLIDNIVRHGRKVLFSAAVPGQGGEDHINERPYEFWRDMFASRGYRLFDFVRPRVDGNGAIEPWYRYNVMFFAHDSIAERLPPEVASTRVPDGARIRDFSPIGFRLRKLLMRSLPGSAVSLLAVWKHKLVVRSLQRRQEST